MSGGRNFDKRLLGELRRDSTRTKGEIADELGVDSETVGNRLDEFEDSGVIRFYRAAVDPAKLGYEMPSYHFVQAADNYDETLEKGLATYNQWSGTQLVMIVLGKHDLVIRKVSEDWSSYDNFAKNLIKNVSNPAFTDRESYRVDERYRWNGMNLPSDSYYPSESVDLSETEQEALAALRNDARLGRNYEQLADRISATPSSAMNAVERLEETDTVLGYTVELDLTQLGWHRAFLGLKAVQGDFEATVNDLLDSDPLHVPYILSGSGFQWADIGVELVFESLAQLDDLTDRIRIGSSALESRTLLSTKTLQHDQTLQIRE